MCNKFININKIRKYYGKIKKIYDKSIYLFIYIGFKLTDYYTKHLQKNKLLKLEPTVKSFIINIINIVIKYILFIIATYIVGIPKTTFLLF